MQQTSQTPHLDQIRPRVLRALHVRGWSAQPGQVDSRFTVRVRREVLGRAYTARVDFIEAGDAVTYSTSGDGAVLVVRDMREEGVIQ